MTTHAATVNSITDENAVTQLIQITFDGANWVVIASAGMP